MSDSAGCCAHLTVKYKTKPVGTNGAVTGWWECAECQSRFIPELAASAAEGPALDLLRIAEIRARAEKATKHVPLTADSKEPEYALECPLCGNSDPELLMSSFDGTRAAGVQIFGIGDAMKELEEFVKGSFEDIPWLLAQLKAEGPKPGPCCPKCGSEKIGILWSSAVGCTNMIECPDCKAHWHCSGLLELAKFFSARAESPRITETELPTFHNLCHLLNLESKNVMSTRYEMWASGLQRAITLIECWIDGGYQYAKEISSPARAEGDAK